MKNTKNSEVKSIKNRIRSNQLKKKMKNLPINIGITGLALLFGLAERGTVAISEILANSRRGFGKSYDHIAGLRNFWDYYDELKNLKENSTRTILWRLQKRGLVDKKNGHYQLTFQGFQIIKTVKTKETEIIWDGKWRIIMFDIPEKERKKRNWLRGQLLCLNYRPVQKSVFVGKHPIKKDLWEDIMEQNLHRCIRLMTVGEIDNEEILHNFFDD